jgi:hypothetical protein
MADLPNIDQAFVDRVFASLSGMEIELDVDPLAFGPKHLNGKIANTRRMLTQCERIYTQVAHILQMYRSALRAAKLDFDLAQQNLLANDPEVRSGRNVRDRDALATMKLHEERLEVARLESAELDLDAVLQVVKSKRTDLKDIQGRLRDQIKMCQEEIGLGAKWGSRLPNGQVGPDLDAAPRPDHATVDDLRNLFAGTGIETQAPEPVEEVPEPIEAAPEPVAETPAEAPEPEAPEPETPEPVQETAPSKGAEDEVLRAFPPSVDPDAVADFFNEIGSENTGTQNPPGEFSIDDILGSL